MCQFKSAICLKDRVFVPDYDSHSDMLKELGIEDSFLHASKTFVRVELSPANGDKTSDVNGWALKVDQDIKPDWWDEDADEQRIRAAVKEWVEKRVLRSGVHTVRDGIWYASANATVKTSANATVYAHANAKVYAHANAKVKAYENATVKAYDNATVYAYDNATVKAYDNATVYAHDNTTVYLPLNYHTKKPVQLSGNAICINCRDCKIIIPENWEVEKHA